MIKVSVLYPNSEGRTFDISDYCFKHMPRVVQLLGASLKGMNVDEGIGGQTPGATAPYLAIGHLCSSGLSPVPRTSHDSGDNGASRSPFSRSSAPLAANSRRVAVSSAANFIAADYK